jgi:hypothetical protein
VLVALAETATSKTRRVEVRALSKKSGIPTALGAAGPEPAGRQGTEHRRFIRAGRPAPHPIDGTRTSTSGYNERLHL